MRGIKYSIYSGPIIVRSDTKTSVECGMS